MSGIVKIRVELSDGTAYEREESFSGDNPRHYGRGAQVATLLSMAKIRAAIGATYGDIDAEET